MFLIDYLCVHQDFPIQIVGLPNSTRFNEKL
jgi:hypothetical protein